MKTKKIIEIDDGGWGDLIGGVFVTVMRMDTYEHVTDEIPLSFFKLGRGYDKKEYLRVCRKIIQDALWELGVSKDEFEIHMCQGFVFSDAEDYLVVEGWDVKRRRIAGSVQNIVENAYRQQVISLGFDRFLPVEQGMYEKKRRDKSVELISRGKFRFFQFIDWIQEDPEERIEHVKTGWRSWSYWRHRILSQAELRQKYREMRSSTSR